MARGERPLGQEDNSLLRFAADLRRLRDEAGKPPYRELGRLAHYSAAALSDAAAGRKLPSLPVTIAYVAACHGDTAAWEKRWHAVAAELADKPADVQTGDGDAEQSPYVGLAAFQPEDAGRFYGRDDLVAHLCERVATQRLVVVVGPSGSGKSSLLRAGLVHHARAKGLHGIPDTPVLIMTPGSHPLEQCAARLAAVVNDSANSLHTALQSNARALHLVVLQAMAEQPAEIDLLVVVDQFEEVFTLCQDTDTRTRFLRLLTTAAQTSDSRARVVLGIRADFYNECMHDPDLVSALRDAQVVVGPMSTTELHSAITQPAIDAGCRLETALISQIVADATGQPGVLPLVSHALLETWRRRRGMTMTVAGYDAAGRLEQAIARTAEALYTDLSGRQQVWARQLFTRLVRLGVNTQDTRRRLSRSELDLHDPVHLDVLERLAHARLVTVDHDSIEISHEALIRCWPRLRDWLNDNREGIRIQRQLTGAASSWEALGHDPGALYRGTRLDQAEQWAKAESAMLTTRERTFLQASLAARARDETATLLPARRRRQLWALMTVLLLLTTTAIAFAVRTQRVSTKQSDLAVRTILGQIDNLRGTNPALAMQLSLTAYRLAPIPETRSSLLSMSATPYATVLPGPRKGPVNSLSFSADGRSLAVGHAGNLGDGSVRLWDVTHSDKPRDLEAFLPGNSVSSPAALSPNGHTLAIVDHDSGDVAQLWDVTDKQRPFKLPRPFGFGAKVRYLTFSPDGHRLAIIGSDDGHHDTIWLWNVTDPRHPSPAATITTSTITTSETALQAAFSADSRILATLHPAAGGAASQNSQVRLWDVTDPQRALPLTAITGETRSKGPLSFSPRGLTLAIGQVDGSVKLWDITDRLHPREAGSLITFDSTMNAVAFSPDRSTAAAANDDGTIQLWDTTDGQHPQMLTRLRASNSRIGVVRFSPNGHTLASGDHDGYVRLHNVTNDVLPARSHGASRAASFSPGGHLLATGHFDGTVGLWDTTDIHRPRDARTLTPRTPGTAVVTLAFSPNGNSLAVATTREVVLYDTNEISRALITDPAVIDTPGPPQPYMVLAFSPDSAVLAVGSLTGVQLWDVTNHRDPRPLAAFDEPTNALAFSPDGLILATTSDSTNVKLWDATDLRLHRQLTTIKAGDPVQSLAFSPAQTHHFGKTYLAIGGNAANLWDVTNPRQPSMISTIPSTSKVMALAFSPHEPILALGGGNTIHLWNVADAAHPNAAASLTTASKGIGSIAFHPHNQAFATAGAERIGPSQTTQLWTTDTDQIADHICQIAWPQITPNEWQQYLPGLTYQPPCA